MKKRPKKPLCCERAVTGSDFGLFLSKTLSPTRIRVLWSDLSEPLRGTDERVGTGPGARNETLAQTRAEEEAVVLGGPEESARLRLGRSVAAAC